MVDTPSGPVLPSANIGSTPTMNDTMTASARATWLALYPNDAARFDAAAGVTRPSVAAGTPPAPPAGNIPGEGNQGTPGAPELGHRLSDDQVTSAIAALQAAGMSDERIMEAIGKDGFSVSEVSEADLAAQRYNADFDIQVRAPSEYKVNYVEAGVPVNELGDVNTFNTNATAFLSALNMPVAMGEGLVESMVAVTAAVNRMTPEAEQLWRQEQRAEMVRHFGDEFPAVIERVDLLLDQVGKDNPIVKSLRSGPAGGAAHTVRTLNAWAKNVQRWNSGKAK